MKTTRTYVAIMAMAASVSLLAACSNEDDAVPPPATTVPPATTPADPVTPTDPLTTPDAGAPVTPAPSSSMSDAKESASTAADHAGDALRSTGDAIAAKTSELKNDAADAAERARQAVADGAARADAAIQDKVGNSADDN